MLKLTNCMQQWPSSEADSFSASKNYPPYMEPNFSFLYSQEPAILLHLIWICSVPYIMVLRSISILSSNLRLEFPIELFPSGFRQSYVCIFIPYCWYAWSRKTLYILTELIEFDLNSMWNRSIGRLRQIRIDIKFSRQIVVQIPNTRIQLPSSDSDMRTDIKTSSFCSHFEYCVQRMNDGTFSSANK
jgi:hypothetical protein